MKQLTSENSVLIACSMLKKELTYILQADAFQGQAVWMEKGLHEHPEKLHDALQAEIDRWAGKKYILLAYGLCGNSILGLKSETAQLAVPQFDDCIRMLLSSECGKKIYSDPRTLYFTDAWMEDDAFFLKKENRYTKKYGEKKGMKMIKIMLSNYRDTDMIDTGLYDVDACKELIQDRVIQCGLQCGTRKGHLRVLRKLIAGQWDEEIVSVNAGTALQEEDFAGRTSCIFGNEVNGPETENISI